jgi:hypothetical protein
MAKLYSLAILQKGDISIRLRKGTFLNGSDTFEEKAVANVG